jgi:hypothetical protein
MIIILNAVDSKIYLSPSVGYMQEYAKDKKKFAQEFEAILLASRKGYITIPFWRT